MNNKKLGWILVIVLLCCAFTEAIRIASDAQITAGINNTTAVSPAGLRKFMQGTNTGLPFRTVSARGIINGLSTRTNDGAMFGPDTAGTKTYGIQEAINSLPRASSPNDRSKPGGGAIYFGPGTYWTMTNIVAMTTVNSNAFTLSFYGSGMTASCIVNSNPVPCDTITIGRRGNGTLLNFYMENMGIFCITNATTNIVNLLGPNSLGTDGFGSVARANIRFCYFGHWTRATNNQCFGFTPSSCAVDSNPNNLIALKVDCNFDDVITVEACSFNYVNGVSLAADHLVFRDNMLEHCGITQQSAANDWPNTSIYRGGGAITITEPGGSVNGSWDGVTAINGNKAWTFSGNIFVNCSRPYIIADQFNRDHYSSGDDFENCGDTTRIITTGSKWTFINQRMCAAATYHYVTNTARWDTSATFLATNQFYHIYMNGGTLSITNLNGGTTNAMGNIIGKINAVYFTNTPSATAFAYTNATPFEPQLVSAFLLCVTADGATKYVAGDRINVEHVWNTSPLAGGSSVSLSYSATNVILSTDYPLTTGNYFITDKGGNGANQPSDWANFRIVTRIQP